MEVEELLNKKNLPFVQQGRDLCIHCLNPDHDDSNPSLRIDKITGIFGCFSCGFKGNIFDYFKEKANVLQIKRDLLKQKLHHKLAENIGLEMPAGAIPFDKEWRGISRETFNHFEAFEHHGTEHVGRVVFPVRGISGKIVGFNGRALSPDLSRKYMISPSKAKFPLFPANPKPINGHVILVEGIFDMLNLYDKGLTNATCAFGTQKVTVEKLNILKMQGVKGIDIFFDGDQAGIDAAKEVAELVEKIELTPRTITLKDTDPGELTAQKVLRLKETLYG